MGTGAYIRTCRIHRTGFNENVSLTNLTKEKQTSSLFKTAICTILVFTCLGGLNKACFASDSSGFQYWSTADFIADLDRDWTATFQEQFRLGDEGGNLYYHHSELAFVYKGLDDWLDCGLAFRKICSEDSTGEWRTENRPQLDVTLKGRISDIAVSTRSRFEYRDREEKKDLWRYRNKVTFKLPLELTELKSKPYLSDEVFINFNEEEYVGNRFHAGVSFSLSENVKADLFYLWQSFRASPGRDDINALGTTLKFLF
jgi:hypothetical protein